MLPDLESSRNGVRSWTSREGHNYSCGRCPVLTQQQRKAYALNVTVWIGILLFCFVVWYFFGPLLVHTVCAAWTLLRKVGA